MAAAAASGDLRCGTVDAWIIHVLTRGAVFATDVTNASRTMLMALDGCRWDDDLLKAFKVPGQGCLPEIRPSSGDFGTVADGLPCAGVRIAGVLGDQQAALVGQRCFAVGDVKNTYGTGAFLLQNTGTTAVQSAAGCLTTVAYQIGKDAAPVYALEGSVAICGAVVQWLRDNLGIIQNAKEVNTLAAEVDDAAGVYFVPCFSGLYAPRWRGDARGAIVGLARFHNKRHIARAALESACFQSREMIEAMNKDSGKPLAGALRVDGGMTASDLTMQMQADLAGVTVLRCGLLETTALGAAFAAGIAVGVWDSLESLPLAPGATEFKPAMDEETRERRFRGWNKAVERTLNSVEDFWENK